MFSASNESNSAALQPEIRSTSAEKAGSCMSLLALAVSGAEKYTHIWKHFSGKFRCYADGVILRFIHQINLWNILNNK